MDRAPNRILVVDDEPALLKMMSIYLGRLGHEVTTSSSAAKAWETFSASPGEFAVAVLDGTMAGVGLQDLARRMLEASPTVCVIAYSGYPVDMTAVEASAPGRVMFLQKPFTSGMLTEAVRRMLAAKKEEL
jgi:DNA-binding NtrC family response regulator